MVCDAHLAQDVTQGVFIANGEMIRVDTAEKKYLGRESSGE